MPKTVMTVDDSVSVRMMIRFCLAEAGFEIVEAVNGQDALDKLEKQAVHMVIADVNMPVLDGITMVRAIRGSPKHRYLPVIMLTTEMDEGMKKKGREAGATGWIVKPFKPEQLLAVVQKVLG